MRVKCLAQEHNTIIVPRAQTRTARSQDEQTNRLTLFIGSMLDTVSAIFWSLFGQVDPSSFQDDESEYDVIWKTALILFGAFNIVAVLVALNMLIAILNDSYVQITVRTLSCFHIFSTHGSAKPSPFPLSGC